MSTLIGHTARVCGVAVSPITGEVLSVSDDKTIRVWDPLAGIELATFQGHTDTVSDCVITPEGFVVR